MLESLVLIKGENLREDVLGSISLGNAKQLVVGRVPSGRMILHIAANSPTDLSNALIEFAQSPGVSEVLTLTLQTRQAS